MADTCPACGGKGYDRVLVTETCYNCGGTGCSTCDDKGYFEWFEQVECSYCSGTGKV